MHPSDLGNQIITDFYTDMQQRMDLTINSFFCSRKGSVSLHLSLLTLWLLWLLCLAEFSAVKPDKTSARPFTRCHSKGWNVTRSQRSLPTAQVRWRSVGNNLILSLSLVVAVVVISHTQLVVNLLGRITIQ